MALEGLFRIPRFPTVPAESDDAGSDANRGDQLVTTVAVSAAVLVVAFIAVLMGMASP
jgi:hypothetical protein